jgi:hypothetical protein
LQPSYGNVLTLPPPVQSWYFFLVDIAVYGFLTWYLDCVIPDEFGKAYPPWFFLTPSYWGYYKSDSKVEADWLSRIQAETSNITIDSEDKDVTNERNLAQDLSIVIYF